MLYKKDNDSNDQWIKLFITGFETVLTGTLFYICYLMMEGTNWQKVVNVPMIQVMTTMMLCYFITTMMTGIVLHKRKAKGYQILSKVVKNTITFGILSGIILYIGDFMDVWSYFFFSFLALEFVMILVFRMTLRAIIKSYRKKGRNLQHVIFAGSSENMKQLYYELTRDNYTGYRVAGYFDFEPNPYFPPECNYLGRPESINEYLKENPDTHYLFCSLPSRHGVLIKQIIDYCENHVVHFYSVPNIFNYLQNQVYLEMMGTVPYLTLHRDPLSKIGNKIVKRTFDIMFSLLFLCTLFPFIFIVVAAITKITMPGPIFFRQKRNGLNDREFYCYKFRSMKVNAQADTLQATKDDPRKTKWGNIMRKTNIDELPQFINVLLGDMSVVGPRPHMLKHTEEYSKIIDKYMVRHFVKPGITGWSQVTGYRGETKDVKDMEGRIRGDIWYIEHWSFGLDLFIIYKTVANTIHGEKNAY